MKWKSVLLGVAISLCCLALGLLGGAWWALAVWAPEMNLSGYLQLIFLLAFWTGGMTAGYRTHFLPWRHGGATGAITGLLLIVLQWFLVPTLLPWSGGLKVLGTGTVMGALGGAVGHNLRRAARRREKTRKALGV